MGDNTAPKRIWLNTAGSYADAYEATIGSETGVTWCDMQQDDDDQEYVRADLLHICIDTLHAIFEAGSEHSAGQSDVARLAHEALMQVQPQVPVEHVGTRQ